MQTRDIPNIITVLRILLVPPVIVTLAREQYAAALLLFAAAGLSDGLDGLLAKHYGWTSRLGSILDPLADKLLLVSSYITLAWVGVIPVWLAAVVLGRDFVIIGGAIAYHFTIEQYEMRPSLISKANTLFQILLVLVLVFDQVVGFVPDWAQSVLVLTVLATSVLSGLSYVSSWTRRALSRAGRKKPR